MKYFDAEEAPFKIYGVYRDGEDFVRMPLDVGKAVSWEVGELNQTCAGGRIRFATNSKNIYLKAELTHLNIMQHFTFIGSAGFDLYQNFEDKPDRFVTCFFPPMNIEESYETSHSVAHAANGELIQYTLNLPLYTGLRKLYIGVDDDAVITSGKPYKNIAPIVYYGSSITQGACAARPGCCYQNMIAQQNNIDYINLGFAGAARGEDIMADHIAGLNMSAFIYDYDNNAPSVEHLTATHERLFLKVRDRHPNLPVIMLSRPKYHLWDGEEERIEVIEKTYKHAINHGDKNVYFISGPSMFPDDAGECITVDSDHPTTLGMYFIAKAIGEKLKRAGF